MTHEFHYPKVVPVPPRSAGGSALSQRALVEASILKCPPQLRPEKQP